MHIDLAARVEVASLKNLPTDCLPDSVPTDKLATLRSRALKRGITKPCPFIEMTDFLPRWVNEVCSAAAQALCPFGVSPGFCRFQVPSGVNPEEAKAKRVDMVKWLAACEEWAIAVDATEASAAASVFLCAHRLAAFRSRCCRTQRRVRISECARKSRAPP